jgi:hypothetical protein
LRGTRILNYPGAPLPEHPGTFPGAPLPEKPAPEVLQAQPLANGARAIPERSDALSSIPAAKAIPVGDAIQPEATGDVALPKPPVKVLRQATALGPNAKVLNQAAPLQGRAIPEPVAAPQSAPAPLAVPAQRIAGKPIYSENPRYAYQASGSKPIPYQWEEGGRGLSELEDDKGVQQDWQDYHEKDARIVAAEAARDFAARNSMDMPKSERIRQARIAKPIPLGDNNDLTPILRQSLEKAKAGKAIPQPAVEEVPTVRAKKRIPAKGTP